MWSGRQCEKCEPAYSISRGKNKWLIKKKKISALKRRVGVCDRGNWVSVRTGRSEVLPKTGVETKSSKTSSVDYLLPLLRWQKTNNTLHVPTSCVIVFSLCRWCFERAVATASVLTLHTNTSFTGYHCFTRQQCSLKKCVSGLSASG